LSAEQQLKRFGNPSAGKTVNGVPLVVLTERVTLHLHSAISVKGVYRIEDLAPDVVGVHQNSVRKFAIEQRT
jgi:hypothetical protein